MTKISLDAIRAVRARVERSVPECKAALEATGGDVEAAVDRLMTPLERAAERSARLQAPLRNAKLDDPPRKPLPPPANEVGYERVLGDFDAAIVARGLWTGKPSSVTVDAPEAVCAFLARWNGVELDASTYFYAAEREHDFVYEDDDMLADAWIFAELLDAGHLFLRGGEVWFRDHDGPTFRVARNFESFLRDILNADLDVLRVVERARLD